MAQLRSDSGGCGELLEPAWRAPSRSPAWHAPGSDTGGCAELLDPAGALPRRARSGTPQLRQRRLRGAARPGRRAPKKSPVRYAPARTAAAAGNCSNPRGALPAEARPGTPRAQTRVGPYQCTPPLSLLMASRAWRRSSVGVGGGGEVFHRSTGECRIWRARGKLDLAVAPACGPVGSLRAVAGVVEHGNIQHIRRGR